MIASSTIQFESYTLIIGELERVPREDNVTDLDTKYLERDRIERCMDENVDYGGLDRTVVSGTGVIIGRT